jgi:uncharacterized protein (DUF433 family)
MDIMIERITANPHILGGKPIIRGTRISVEFILDLLASDVSEEEILEDYPHLTKEDIQACLRYAARSCKNEIYVELEPVAA